MSITNKNNKEHEEHEEKVASPYSIKDSPENFLFVALVILLGLYSWYSNQPVRLTAWRDPTLHAIYWSLIFILGIIITIALWFYIKIILADVFLKPENLTKEALTKRAKALIKWSFLYYVLFVSGPSLPEIKYAIFLFFGYYCGEKIYIRIIKKVDFITESAKQRYQTRRNNRFLLLFPFLYLITLYIPTVIAYILSFLYLAAIFIWYNKWPITEEEYTVTKAPVGSEERLELLKEALGVFEEDEPLLAYDNEIDDELEEDVEYGPALEIEALSEPEEEEFDLEELKLERDKKKLFQEYFIDKLYPIHEYYLWWLMKDAPFYFTIKAIYHMFMDVICWIIRLTLLIPILVLTYFATAMPFSVPVSNQIFWFFTILFFCILVPTGWLALSSIHVYYSWYAFFHREEAYSVFDDIHPYVMTGPTVDGPHTWQYWFYVFFSYFPSRAFVLQQQVFDEEVRLAEITVELDRDFVEIMDDEEEDSPVTVDIWNPIDLIWLRNASPREVQKYKEKLKEQERFQVPDEIVKAWKETLDYQRPRWWRHYYI